MATPEILELPFGSLFRDAVLLLCPADASIARTGSHRERIIGEEFPTVP
jgi:hypothetical protein